MKKILQTPSISCAVIFSNLLSKNQSNWALSTCSFNALSVNCVGDTWKFTGMWHYHLSRHDHKRKTTFWLKTFWRNYYDWWMVDLVSQEPKHIGGNKNLVSTNSIKLQNGNVSLFFSCMSQFIIWPDTDDNYQDHTLPTILVTCKQPTAQTGRMISNLFAVGALLPAHIPRSITWCRIGIRRAAVAIL